MQQIVRSFAEEEMLLVPVGLDERFECLLQRSGRKLQ